MIPVLQNRWKLTGTTLVYYGLPQPPRLFRRRISLSPSAARTVAMLDGRRPLEDYPNPSALRRLIRRGVVVDVKDRKAAPASLDEARFCRRCAANDYAIPGLELDENGLCPICNTEKRFRKCKNVLPVLDRIPTSVASGAGPEAAHSGPHLGDPLHVPLGQREHPTCKSPPPRGGLSGGTGPR